MLLLKKWALLCLEWLNDPRTTRKQVNFRIFICIGATTDRQLSNILQHGKSSTLPYWTPRLWLQLSNRPVSRDHVAGFRSRNFLKFTAAQELVLGWISGSPQLITLGVKLDRVHAKGRFRLELTPGALTFIPIYSLYNRLLEGPWYIGYVISTNLPKRIDYLEWFVKI